MLMSAVNIAGNVCEDSVYNPWNNIIPEGYAAVVADLKRAYDVVVVHRKDARDTSERWFCVASIDSSVVGESSGQQGVRISNIVEVGDMEYLPQSVSVAKMPSKSFSGKSPVKEKWRKIETPAPVVVKRRFGFDDESVLLPKRRGCTLMTPILQLPSKNKINLFDRAEVTVVVVLRQSFSQVPVNFYYQLQLYFSV